MVEWVAQMVTPAVDLVAPVFRRTVDLDHGTVTSAVLHVSSLGVHECFIDGVPVSPEVLSPGWSAYEWRVRYRSHDVTPLLRDGSGADRRARQRLVARPARLPRWPGAVRRPARADRPARGDVRRRARAGGRDRRVLDRRAVGHHRRRPLRRPDHRRAAPPPGSNTAGLERPVAGRRSPVVRLLPPGDCDRAPGGAPRDSAPRADLELTVRGDLGRLRAEPGGLAAVRRAGAARLGDPDPACGGAGGGRARRTPAA